MTVKQRLVLLGCLTLILVAALVAGMAWMTSRAIDSTRESRADTADLVHMLAARNAVGQAVLGAMDTIVDRGDRDIAAERQAEINAGLVEVERASTLPGHAPAFSNALRDGAANLRRLIETDLYGAVRNGASDADFDRLDDLIDGQGGDLTTVIDREIAERDARTQASAAALTADLDQTRIIAWTGGGIGLVLILGLVALTGRSILGPLSALRAAMERLAQGDTDAVVPRTEAQDELGAMARTVAVFRENAIARARLEAEAEIARADAAARAQAESERQQREAIAAAAAEAEQERRASAERMAERVRLAGEFEARIGQLVQSLTQAAGNLTRSAQSVAEQTEITTGEVNEVGQGSERALLHVDGAAAAAEELSASVTEISRRVAQSATVAGNAVRQAGETDTMVQGLSNAAHRIEEVVQLINSIAGQTNLLALNATIEAARAGEAGKGFAVVASEVKSLANQTARATDDIAAQVNAIQAATADAVRAIAEITRTIGAIDQDTAAIAAAVEEQGSATAEIAHNVSDTAQITRGLKANVDRLQDTAARTGVVTGEMQVATSVLNGDTTRLQEEVRAFVSRLRAA
ncbi:methyl-accepting chemotaxis protein [Zavarzinia sp. CC-PAN008]|uniref:methyl-accepting chemotaxis protein n=1 Tax=Zavarzinia sp. CC-PAN008 TaxID=3243332 RepID=UPI003F749C1F